MSRLTAIYEIELPSELRAQRAEDDELSYRVSIGHFDVEVILLRNGGASLKAINDQHVTMKSPHLHEFIGHEDCFMNPIWRDENGESLQPGILEFSGRIISAPGPALLGERAFTAADDSNFEECFIAGIIPETYQEFLSDAQTSARAGNLPRAILEIAIACEVAVK